MIDALVRQMLLPSFYGLPAGTGIRHIQTHISHVFLTGEFAYKIKKPVNLGFLDFSTLEKREFYCREELRLNRRFAPTLYLGVLSITQSGESFALEPTFPGTNPVEFALKMRQFDERDLLTNWLRDERLTEAHIRDIARKMVNLHRDANTDTFVASFGTPEAVEKMIDDNFASVKTFIGRALDAGQFDQIRSTMMDAFRANRLRIDQRARNGQTRECHGDLHLRNMCWFSGEFQFFDCIEFNEEYRCIDVMYELAFLAMDLEYRGRADLSNALMNEYLERSGDYEGATLLQPYLALRAWIRAKVACLKLEDSQIGLAELEEARSSAARHFNYAERRMRPRSPSLTLVCGVSGTGKSTLARELCKRMDAIHIRSDAIRKHIAGVELDSHASAIYTDEITEATCATMAEHARTLLQSGWNIIMDATFQRAAHRVAARNVADECGAAFHILHLTAPPRILSKRISRRTDDISDAPPDLHTSQRVTFESFTDIEQARLIEIDTTNPIEHKSLARQLTIKSNP